MENNFLMNAVNCVPSIIKNTHLNLSLEGWPAATSIIAGCMTIIAVVGIISSSKEATPQNEGVASPFLLNL